jgi:hypothetical protein
MSLTCERWIRILPFNGLVTRLYRDAFLSKDLSLYYARYVKTHTQCAAWLSDF